MEGYGNENPGAFQSTRPLRGATVEPKAVTASKLAFQPTRPLRGATRWSTAPKAKAVFQPTRPLRGATITSILIQSWYNISTHAPLAGRDKVFGDSSGQPVEFQPTRPLRGATNLKYCEYFDVNISTHAPLAGRDSKSVQITMHIFAITDKFQMLLHRMPPVRAFCSFLMQESHADFGCEPPK